LADYQSLAVTFWFFYMQHRVFIKLDSYKEHSTHFGMTYHA